MDDRVITLICTVRSEITIPGNLKNEEEVREYLSWAYSIDELVKDCEEVVIEEIEGCPQERDDFDEFDDKWHSDELN